MKKPILCAVLLVASAAWADTPRTVVNEADQNTTVDCGDGGELVVNGADNRLTVTGGCVKVTINGSGNTVAIDAADRISINGADNKVTYKRGWKSKSPKILRTGSNNKVSQG